LNTVDTWTLLTWFVAGMCLLTLASLVYSRLTRRAPSPVLRLDQLARSLGFESVRARRARPAAVLGEVAGLPFRLESLVDQAGGVHHPSIRITVEGLPAGLTLGLEGPARAWRREDIQAGLADFDRLFRMEARRDVELLARLGERTRLAMVEAIAACDARVGGGAITWESSGRPLDPDDVERTVRAILELADALAEHAGPPARGLLHHVRHDPEPEFRRRALEALLRELPRSFEAKEALPLAEEHPDPALRYLAARQRGEAGLATIRALVAEGLPEELAEEARALLAPQHGGGLSLSEQPGGALSLDRGGEGGLSEAQSMKRARKERA